VGSNDRRDGIGPYGGVVTDETTDDPSISRVTATWTRNGQTRSTTATVPAAAAPALVQQWADRLAGGHEPLE
jgi:hypothetical protein